MAFAGFKKQINKANQYVTEKMGGAEGTKLDMDFMEMERKTDVTVELVEELQMKTKEYLQPNPTARAKMAAVKGISKLSGQAKSNTYPQPEGLLADCMLTYGKKLGDDSVFANALVEFGEALKQMADVKYSLDDNVKQNVLEPLHHLQTKDLKEVMHHRKKLQGRRLDFDCKRRRQAKDDEIRSAEEKFAESLQLAQMGMFHLLENDVEQVSQLVTFSEALYDFHSQCAEILKGLTETLQEKREEAESRPKSDFVPKTLGDLNIDGGSTGSVADGGANYFGNGFGGGGGHFGDVIKTGKTTANGRHYPPLHIKPNISNSHHQQLYSSQQNISTSAKNFNNTFNNNTKNSNFVRNRFYGSQQSLAGAKLSIVNNNSNINNNNNTNKTSSSKNGNSIDLDSSYDWLNAWNNPPPVVPPATTSFTTKSTLTSSTTTSSKQISNYSSNTKTIVHINDPWTVTKPSHLELDNGHTQARSTNASPLPSPMRSPAKTPANKAPYCTALYDFEPENPGELGFKENDAIQLLNRVDENWFEGSVNGRTGYFPQSYVQIVVPLPN